MAESINITDLAIKPAAALTTADSIVTFTADGDTNQTPMFEAVAKANGDNGCVCVQTAKLFIPTAEVLTLNSVPKAFGLTVPAGYYVQPLSVNVRSLYNTTPYATFTSMEITVIGVTDPIATIDISFNVNLFIVAGPDTSGAGEQIDEGQDINVSTSGDPTAGDSDITIYLTYALIEL